MCVGVHLVPSSLSLFVHQFQSHQLSIYANTSNWDRTGRERQKKNREQLDRADSDTALNLMLEQRCQFEYSLNIKATQLLSQSVSLSLSLSKFSNSFLNFIISKNILILFLFLVKHKTKDVERRVAREENLMKAQLKLNSRLVLYCVCL